MADKQTVKVGDRITAKLDDSHNDYRAGNTFYVQEIDEQDGETIVVFTDNVGDKRYRRVSEFTVEHVPVADATGKPALTIETGKFYRTRDGRKVGPMRRQAFGWVASKRIIATDQCDWYEGGNFSLYRDREHDLISEWVDEPASNDNRPATKPAIVALIEKGQPKPSELPRVHASEYAAIKEAKRLANRHKGQQFGVFALSKTVSEPIPLYEHEWQNLAANGQKVAAIKELRRITGLGLAATKRAIEHWAEHDEQSSRRAA
ncbi:hypothetical protein QBD01_002397 [Ochrobactrum sp. 19YEA23]|uniref:hypothetical protein n=1 Tax=Ochrobactrum sp. 19YEA23 TaxID=3039854 RepID=UPI00247A6639|nr:hypothetical protein [Ochrobactrum sp. 19YEA23]